MKLITLLPGDNKHGTQAAGQIEYSQGQVKP